MEAHIEKPMSLDELADVGRRLAPPDRAAVQAASRPGADPLLPRAPPAPGARAPAADADVDHGHHDRLRLPVAAAFLEVLPEHVRLPAERRAAGESRGTSLTVLQGPESEPIVRRINDPGLSCDRRTCELGAVKPGRARPGCRGSADASRLPHGRPSVLTLRKLPVSAYSVCKDFPSESSCIGWGGPVEGGMAVVS